jgi:hypothetical protein
MHLRKPFLAAVAAALALPTIGCVSVREDRSPAPVATRPKGPPSHAPAHGYRRKREYVRYPSCNVYFDRERALWFWLEGEEWRVGAKLPSSIRIDVHEGVTVELEGDMPYASESAEPGRGKGRKH